MLSKKYLADPRMSQSALKRIFDGAGEFKYWLDNRTEETDAMRLGSAVHLLVLEPHKKDQIICLPKINGSTREGKIWNLVKLGRSITFFKVTDAKTKKQNESFYEVDHEEYDFARQMISKFGAVFKEPEGKIFLSEADLAKAEAMAASVRANTDAKMLLDDCNDFEIDMPYSHKNIDFKSQLDGLGFDCVIDLKTTKICNNTYEIKREILSRLYHFQAASYLIASKRIKYFIIFVRNEAPYTCFPVELSSEILQEGKELFEQACGIYSNTLIYNPDFITDSRLQLI